VVLQEKPADIDGEAMFGGSWRRRTDGAAAREDEGDTFAGRGLLRGGRSVEQAWARVEVLHGKWCARFGTGREQNQTQSRGAAEQQRGAYSDAGEQSVDAYMDLPACSLTTQGLRAAEGESTARLSIATRDEL